jgi:hypothetical protein
MLVIQKQVTKFDFSFSQTLDISTHTNLLAKRLLEPVRPTSENLSVRIVSENLIVLTREN